MSSVLSSSTRALGGNKSPLDHRFVAGGRPRRYARSIVTSPQAVWGDGLDSMDHSRMPCSVAWPQLFGGLFGQPKPKPAPVKPVRPTVTPGPSYNLPLALLAISGFEFFEGVTGLAAFTAVLGVFLTIQATRIRCFGFMREACVVNLVLSGAQERCAHDSNTDHPTRTLRFRFRFDDEGLEVVQAGSEKEERENVFVGGKNRWTYDSFVNWEFW